MAAISHGMDIAQIEALGNKLQADLSQRIGEIALQLEKLVGDTSAEWIGPDADAFRSWWPAKRSRLAAIAEDLHGFGQSALNNVSEQRQASGVGTVAPAPSVVGGGSPGTTPGGPLPGHGRTREQILDDYDRNWRLWEDELWRNGGPDGSATWGRYQCTAWVWYRLRELGYEGDRIPQGDLDNRVYAERAFGATRDTVPEPGAIVAKDKHIMIAEDVSANEQGQRVMRVSEMNSGSDGSDAAHGNRSEYRDTETWVEQADGTWRNSRTGDIQDFSIANVVGNPRV